jgi:hypothetical protein
MPKISILLRPIQYQGLKALDTAYNKCYHILGDGDIVMKIGAHTKLVKIPVICCGCKAAIRWKLVNIEQAGYVTHGLCQKCGPKLYPGLWEEK